MLMLQGYRESRLCATVQGIDGGTAIARKTTLRRLPGAVCRTSISNERYLHHQGELLELFLHALDRAAYGLDARGGIACLVAGDSVAAAGEEGADEVGSLPGIQAGAHELLAK